MYYWQVILIPGLEMGILMKTLISFIDKNIPLEGGHIQANET